MCGSRERWSGRAEPCMREQTRMGRIALAVAVVVALAGASGAPAGGIADEPCPNARGEQTNTCPAGTVGVPYSLRFVESEGSGCGSGRQTFHLDSGLLPHGLILTPDGTLKGIALETGSFKFYVEMREPQDDPSTCAGKRTQKEFTLRIRAQPWITSTPASPLGPEVGIPFRLTLRARGGTGIFHWDVGAGRLPVGAATPRRRVNRGHTSSRGHLPLPRTSSRHRIGVYHVSGDAWGHTKADCSGSTNPGRESGSLLQRQTCDRRGYWSNHVEARRRSAP